MAPLGRGATALAALGAWALGGCIPDNHPLPASGSVEILLDGIHPIYAADLIDDVTGRPVLPRQAPYEKHVQLLLSENQQPDEGAYVDVRLDPPGVLVDESRSDARDGLVPVDDGETGNRDDDSCQQLAGAFRCTADADGYASFIVRSESDWSGEIAVKIAGRSDERAFEVKPAGLPSDTTGFTMIIGGVDQNADKVAATYSRMTCLEGHVPDEPWPAWPEGSVRSLEAVVRANQPPATPDIVKHAPVTIQTLHSEAKLSLDPSCPASARTTRLRVQLQPKTDDGAGNPINVGESPPFYLCFSDIGGTVQIDYFSGEMSNQEPRQLLVEPEPRVMRLTTLVATMPLGAAQQPVVEVSAFDSRLDPVSIPVDVISSAPETLALNVATLQLSSDVNVQSQITADAVAAGQATIRVTPRLFASPRCDSSSITVVEP